jgi:hypothetical protein
MQLARDAADPGTIATTGPLPELGPRRRLDLDNDPPAFQEHLAADDAG